MTSKLYYTAHHNWRWVIDEVLRVENVSALGIMDLAVYHCSRMKELPSVLINSSSCSSLKPQYALFRFEIENRNGIVGAWSDSLAFAFLDNKDALYQHLMNAGMESVMPQTHLLPWDVSNILELPIIYAYPKLLKAASGSGGFGIYFVFSADDIISVTKFHATKAIKEPNFLNQLRMNYNGSIPMWSLQEFVSSIKVLGGRRCQIRAYAVYCRGVMYLFQLLEVRVPSWGGSEIDDIILGNCQSQSSQHQEGLGDVVEQYDAECCSDSSARPYNLGRKKAETQRFTFDEIPELFQAKESIFACLNQALGALQAPIERQCQVEDNHSSIAHLAVAGIDVVLSQDSCGNFIPKILEINNNPAMPALGKCMSAKYNAQLVKFVENTFRLGLDLQTSGNFCKIW